MSYTLEEVKVGLGEGKSYKRKFRSGYKLGWEIVKPLRNGRFEHTVAGPDFGGVAELDISIMTADRWAVDGWDSQE